METVLKVKIPTIEKVKQFVNLASKQPFDIDIVSSRFVVDAKSIMGIFSLDITQPLELHIYEDAGSPNLDSFIESLKPIEVN